MDEDIKLNEAIADAFRKSGKAVVNKAIKAELKKVSKELESKIELKTPVETGELKRKMASRVGRRSTIAANYIVGVNANKFKTFSPKASITEYGRKDGSMPEQKYMRSTFDNNAELIANKLRKAIFDALEKEIND